MTSRARVCLTSGMCLAGLVTALRAPQAGAAQGRTYHVHAGDTLSAIALRMHSSQGELIRLNGIADPDHLRVGQVLTVAEGSDRRGDPGSGYRVRAADPAPASNYQERPAGYQPETTTYPTATTSQAMPGADAAYVVRPGDTLGALSSRFGVSIATLAGANGILRPDLLRVGQRLLIPTRMTTTGSIAGTTVASLQSSAPSTPIRTASTTTSASSIGGTTRLSVAGSTAPGTGVGALLTSEAQAYGLDPALVKAVAWQESGWQMVVARDGGIGVMQLMPATAAWVGPALLGRAINPNNLTDNIQAGVALLASYVRQFGDVRSALIAYNAGPGSVTRNIGAGTAQYVANVLALRAGYAQ